MKKNLSILSLIVVFVALSAVLTFSANKYPIAPNFQGYDVLTGEKISSKDLKGKVVIIDFWATWCKPCKKSLPKMDKIYKKYKSKGLVVIGISVDENNRNKPDKARVKNYLKNNKVSFPIMMFNKNIIKKFGKHTKKGIHNVPYTFVIGKNGKIYRVFTKEIKNYNWFEKLIRVLIKMK